MAIKRLHYFNGQFLKEPDFTDEQTYHLEMRRRHQQHLHTPGIGWGLTVTAGTNKVTVGPGMAIDALGREIIVEAPQDIPVSIASDIAISYKEEETDETTETGVKGNRRWTESAVLATAAGLHSIVLAKVTGVSAGQVTLDSTFRPTYAGPAVMGDLAVGRDLTVQGNLRVQGETTVVQTQKMRGNVQLGDEDTDTITIEGRVLSGHSTGKLQIGSPVAISGDLTVTGPLTLPGNPTTPLHAAPKQYVDAHIAAPNPHAGSVAKAGDTMTGPLTIMGGNWDVGATEGDLKVGDATFRMKIGVARGGAGAGDVRIRAQGGTNRLMLGGGTGDDLTIQNGNVGISNITPVERLDVNGRVKSGSLTMGPWPANPTGYMFFGVNTLNQAGAGNYALLQGIADGPGRTFLNSPVDIRFRIGNTDRMILENSGNVGIGTVSPAEKLHVQGNITLTGAIAQEDWKAVTLLNSWVAYGRGYNPPGHFIDKQGIVHLRGLVQNGTIGQAIFTLPGGYQPPNRELYAVQTATGLGRCDITSDGQVIALQGGNGWFSLDGITFRAGAEAIRLYLAENTDRTWSFQPR